MKKPSYTRNQKRWTKDALNDVGRSRVLKSEIFNFGRWCYCFVSVRRSSTQLSYESVWILWFELLLIWNTILSIWTINILCNHEFYQVFVVVVLFLLSIFRLGMLRLGAIRLFLIIYAGVIYTEVHAVEKIYELWYIAVLGKILKLRIWQTSLKLAQLAHQWLK